MKNSYSVCVCTEVVSTSVMNSQ